MLGSFERLRMGNALTLTEETLRSRHRFELQYILGSFCERFANKRGHAGLSTEILHNLLSLRSRSLRPSVNRRTLAGGGPFMAQGCNCQLHIRRSCAPILTGSRSELSDTLGRAATGHAQLSK